MSDLLKECRVSLALDRDLNERIERYISKQRNNRPPGVRKLSKSQVVREALDYFLTDNYNGKDLAKNQH